MIKPLIPLGSRVNLNGWRGLVVGVAWLGERYYFLDDKGSISMVPESALRAA